MAQIVVEGLEELRQALARMDPVLDQSLGEAIADASRLGAAAVQDVAPVRSGMLKGSVRGFIESGTVGGVEVTARRRSRGYPGGYPYPARVDRQRGFMRRGIQTAAPKVQQRLEGVLDDIQRAFGG
ncbi:MAG: hypothetical protein AB7O78_01665 [Thermoleophilia bacterium]